MNKLRVAIIGCGYWGQNLVRNFSELDEVELRTVSDFDLNSLARIKRRHPTVGLTHNYQDVISDPRIDAVVIATPWPEYRALSASDLAGAMAGRLLVDPFRLIDARQAEAAGLEYHTLGMPPLGCR